MFEDVKKNKFKTGVIVSIFLVCITLMIYYICMAFHLGYLSIVIALAFSILSTFGSYFYSDKIVLKLNRARPATPEEDKKLVDILDALLVASGLPNKPKLYVMECEQPNAFATGRNPANAVICVTTGLLDKLDYYELEGVVAHELAHIKNYDILLSAVVSVMVGLVIILADLFTRVLFWGGGKDRDSDSKGNGIIMIVGLVFLILSPIFSQLMQLAISRRREFLADATSVQFTRNPEGLISALRKIDGDSSSMEGVNKSTAYMYIAEPLREDNDEQKRKKAGLFDTHPSTEDRIRALENIK